MTEDEGGAVLDRALTEALEERYLAYALSTITGRALPDVRDGLKPVHRRILHVMRELKLDPDGAFRKCAKVVGDVIGRFHPHGDQAVYDALVRLAQTFAARAPLIDGQGNFGNVDGDSAAAMRYTEARLTDAGAALLEGIDEDAVDFRESYDGLEREPCVLPSTFPNLLVNGASGIAVGMATSIPPHNLDEACAAARLILRDPDAPIDALLERMPGPDFPTGGVVVEEAEAIRAAYATGRGSVRVRARWTIEEGARGAWRVVVTDVPYQVAKSRLVAKLDELVHAKKLPLVGDVEDESAEDVRIVLTPKTRNVDAAVMMESVFRASDLESRFTYNMNVLDFEGRPKVMDLRAVLQAFIEHRFDVLRRRTAHRLGKRRRRLEIVEGQLLIHLNIDEVIRIIRESDEPKPELILAFGLTDLQADSVLDTRLRALRKLEEEGLKAERDRLIEEIAADEALLASDDLQRDTIDGELVATADRFAGDPLIGVRRTALEGPPDALVTAEALSVITPKEPITVVLSQKGWIRAFKGHDLDLGSVRFKEGDGPGEIVPSWSTDKLALIGSDGRSYALPCQGLPDGRGEGAPLRLHVELDAAAEPVAIIDPQQGSDLLLVASDGRGFRIARSELASGVKTGKRIMTPQDGARLAEIRAVSGEMVAFLGEDRRLLVFPVTELPVMSRGRGAILQRYPDGGLSDVTVFPEDAGLYGRDAAGRRVEVKNWRAWLGKRGQRGRPAPKGFPRTGRFHQS